MEWNEMLSKLQTLQVSVNDGVCWVTLNRPEVLNTISAQMLSDIRTFCLWAAEEPAVRVVVIKGAGRAFCAGADIDDVDLNDGLSLALFLKDIQDAFHAIRHLPKPVIAAVNGIAAGGGLELLLCADFVLASEDARFSDAHANIGAIPGAGGCAVLPRRINPSFAKYMVFSGAMVSASDMYRLGLVVAVYPSEEFHSGIASIACRIANNSVRGVSMMKRIIDDGLVESTLEDALGLEIEANKLHAGSRDFAEGIAAFREKRKPIFNDNDMDRSQGNSDADR